MNLCLSCLATGREDRAHAPKHSRSHRYRVVDNLASMHLFEREFFSCRGEGARVGRKCYRRQPHFPARLTATPFPPQQTLFPHPHRRLER